MLVANRGEIAVRIIRACHDLDIEAIAVFSDVDRGALHVRLADEAIAIGGRAPLESYLHGEAILDAARRARAEAIHPGYGFLAERASFAAAVEQAGLVFVGPGSEVIGRLGDKLAARRLATEAGVQVVPGTLEAVAIDPQAMTGLLDEAGSIGFPLLVKAAAGGGGRGMRLVERAADLPAALAGASAESAAAFGDGAVYMERRLEPARHIEVQLLGDAHGRVVSVGERDCSLQRRHQKLVEEAPAPGLTPGQRVDVQGAAVRLGQAAGLQNAATAEFLLTPDGAFHFLEVNTRLQVEHGVTELVTGLDLVQEQLWLAAGRPLSDAALAASEAAAAPASHAIEVRIAAEDPAAAFVPTPGPIRAWAMPGGPGVRVDSGVEAGSTVPPDYDNLVAKIMVVAATRGAAVGRLSRALDEAEVAGIQTTLPFHRFVASSPDFRDPGQLSIDWVARHWDGSASRARVRTLAAVAAAGWLGGHGGPAGPATGTVSADGREELSGWRVAGRTAGIDRWPDARRHPRATRADRPRGPQ